MNQFRRVLTLAAGNNKLADLMKAADANFRNGFMTSYKFKVISGPVAKNGAAMAAFADGAPYAAGAEDGEAVGQTGAIDAGTIHFFPTSAGDKIFVQAVCR